MEADAKKKRGRPRSVAGDSGRNAFPELEARTATNTIYAGICIMHVLEERHPFFVTEKGQFRHNGIAEQIGRMYADGTITKEQGKQLVTECIDDYAKGAAVKQIEKRLRMLHQALK